MKKLIISSFLVLLISFCSYSQADWNTGGNNIAGTEWFGADNTSTIPLEIRNDANRPILFSTAGNENMEIAAYRNVGIGTFGQGIRPKLYVRLTNANASGSPFASMGILGANEFTGTSTYPINRGVQGYSIGENVSVFTENYGGDFYSRYANVNVGVQGAAGIPNIGIPILGEQGYGVVGLAERHSLINIGVFGRATCPNDFLNAWTVGVLGTAPIDPCNDGWACWFEGDTYSTSGTWNASDQTFKTNVQDLNGALSVIEQLEPKSYNYDTEEYPTMNFPSGQHYGLIAQELEEVLPHLVRDVFRGAQHDSLGNEIIPRIDFKAVNYSELIPVLLAGMKEQQAIINAQNDLLAEVLDRLEAVENCCNSERSHSTPGNSGVLPEKMLNEKSIDGSTELYQNIPNPFRESTTISYSLEEGGRVQLSIYDKTGKVVTTLTNANQGPGRYSEVWNANRMPSGVYHYALYVNGELLVKRAIKLQE
jgi:hypothetical protein